MKYRKKTVEVEAVQFKDDADTLVELQEFMQSELRVSYENPDDPILKVETPEGIKSAHVGDYVVKCSDGNYYPYEQKLFEINFEAAEINAYVDGKKFFDAVKKENDIYKKEQEI